MERKSHHVVQPNDGLTYVTNGACIEAARRLGLVLLCSPTSSNAVIGISQRSVRELDQKSA